MGCFIRFKERYNVANKNYLEVESTDALSIGKTYPFTFIEIMDNGRSLGKLIIDEKGGKLRFEGDVEKSAQVFFDETIRMYSVYLEV